jgi:hypothetical protein
MAEWLSSRKQPTTNTDEDEEKASHMLLVGA